jgi:hypothetical protein
MMTATQALSKPDLDALVKRLDLVDPTDPAVRAHAPAPRLATLAGVRIGLLDNRKPNAALLLAELGALLHERFELEAVEPRSKFIYSRPAAPEIVDELAGCDAVITAIGD